MWAYQAWQGLHFPARLARGDQLRVYASWCNAVEGNTTFYGLPSPTTVAAWAAAAPESFRFVFKLPRTITHGQHLRDVAADHRALLERLAPLGARAEQLSIQLPPLPNSVLRYDVRTPEGPVSFADNSANKPKSFDELAQFSKDVIEDVCGIVR